MFTTSSSSRVAVAGAVLCLGVGALVGCSGGGSVSSGSTASAAASASPGSVPQAGQIIASAPLSSGGYEASRCGGRDQVLMEALQSAARERGWTVDRASTDSEGCWSAASMPVAGGQRASLAVEENEATGTASLRVVDVVASSTAAVVAPTRSATASVVASVGGEN